MTDKSAVLLRFGLRLSSGMNPFNPGTKGTPCCCVKDLEDELAEDATCYCAPRWVKHSILLCGWKQSFFPLQCLIGTHWPIMLTTYAQIIGFSLLFIFLITAYMPVGFTYAAVVSMLAVVVSFGITASTDPGIVYKNSTNEIGSARTAQVAAENSNAAEAQLMLECSQCNLMRPRTARHCHFCGVCVNKVWFKLNRSY